MKSHGREIIREGWFLLGLLLVLAIILGCTLWFTDACGTPDFTRRRDLIHHLWSHTKKKGRYFRGCTGKSRGSRASF